MFVNKHIVWKIVFDPLDGSPEAMAAAKTSMEVVAVEFKKANHDSDLLFFCAGKDDDDDIAGSLRSFAKFPNKTPLLALVDIPNQIGYTSDAEVVNQQVVHDMVKSYKEGTLQGKPLR